MEKQVYEFISKKSGEKIVEWKKCSCGEDFAITNKDIAFYDKISPVFGGKKYSIPTPTLCPDCRLQRKLTFRNIRSLYKRKCSATGKSIISIYSPDKPYKIYNSQLWRGDTWDATDYGRKIDFNKTFFEQFEELFKSVPKQNLYNIESENSDYCSLTYHAKDCYMTTGVNIEKCIYGLYVSLSKDCTDYVFSMNDQNCYQDIESDNCYNVHFSQEISNCRDCFFMYNCNGCIDCFGCVNLNNKQYYYFNELKTKEEYIELISKISWNNKTIDSFRQKHNELIKQYPRLGVQMKMAENSYGHNIISIKDSKFCFDCNGVNGVIENCAFTSLTTNVSNCYDLDDGGNGNQYCLDSISVIGHKIFFSHLAVNSDNTYYSINCHNSSNIFGCEGLRNKKYCILNKQYTKEEYEELVPKIIEHMKKTGEWGEFFPASISPFGYNETMANDNFPIEKVGNEYFRSDDLERKYSFPTNQFNWSDYENPKPDVVKIIPGEKLPDNIADIPDDILNWAIECEVSGKPFRIIKQELEFYRKHNLPVPRRHPDVRHMDRMNKRAPRKLFLKNCDKCGVEIISVYNKHSEYKVYCEECYNNEVV